MDKNLKNEYLKADEQFESFHKAVTVALNELQDTEIKKFRFSKTVKIAVAAAATIAVLGVTAFGVAPAVKRIIEKSAPYQMELNISDVTQGNKAQAPQYIGLRFNYLPEGMVQTDDILKYCFKDNMFKGGISASVYNADDLNSGKINNVASAKEITVGQNKAFIWYPAAIDSDGSRYMAIYYENLNSVLLLFAGGDVSDGELMKIAEGAELYVADEANDVGYEKNLGIFGLNNLVSDKIGSVSELSANIIKTVAEKKFDVDGYVLNGEDVNLSVEIGGVKYVDSIESLNKGSIVDRAYEDYDLIDSNGKIKPYVRKTVNRGDGINTVDTVEKEEKVNRKLMLVDLTVTNSSKSDALFSIPRLESNSGDLNNFANYVSACENAPAGFYVSDEDGASSRIFLPTVKAGSKRVITVGLLVDEDKTDENLYLRFDAPSDFNTENETFIVYPIGKQ